MLIVYLFGTTTVWMITTHRHHMHHTVGGFLYKNTSLEDLAGGNRTINIYGLNFKDHRPAISQYILLNHTTYERRSS